MDRKQDSSSLGSICQKTDAAAARRGSLERACPDTRATGALELRRNSLVDGLSLRAAAGSPGRQGFGYSSGLRGYVRKSRISQRDRETRFSVFAKNRRRSREARQRADRGAGKRDPALSGSRRRWRRRLNQTQKGTGEQGRCWIGGRRASGGYIRV